MPKKATKTKTATKMVKKTPKIEEFNPQTHDIHFTIDTAEQANEVIAYLKQLETTVGWIYLKKTLQLNMEILERSILTRVDQVTGERMTEEESEHMRRTFLIYEELVDKPAQLIANLEQGNVPTAPDYDPFARDINSKRSEENYASVLRDDDADADDH